MEDIRVSLVQADLVWEDPNANFKHLNELLSGLKGKTDLVVLPEMFNTGFSVEPARIAERMDGDSVQYLIDKAKELGAVVVASIIIREEDKYYNRLVWAKPDGEIHTYDKKHLFRMGGEHHRFDAGEKHLVAELKGWKVMPLICYDLRFPVYARNAFANNKFKYDMLIYIANWPGVRAHPWKTLLRARAIENQCVAIGVNRVGEDGNQLTYTGDSALIDAKGLELSSIPPSQETVETICLKAEDLLNFRDKFQVGLDWDDIADL